MTKVKDVLNSEITNSKKIIEQNINSPITLFAYPFGIKNAVNDQLFNLMKSSGFDAAFTSILGLNTKNQSVYQLNRIAPLGFETIGNIKTKIYWADNISRIKSILNHE